MAHAVRWSKNGNPLVRQAGIILLADFPGAEVQSILEGCSGDEAPDARIGVARAIGFGQFKDNLPVLARLLDDKDSEVATAAALSLVSFSPVDAGGILRATADHPSFKPIFVNALSESDPQPYLQDLAEIIEKRLDPEHFWGGRIPYARSWDILFAYVKRQDTQTLESLALTRCLNALEGAKFHGSGEPRDLYALYVEHKMTDRAVRFRNKCKTAIPFDMEYYFDAVDKRYGLGTKQGHDNG